MKFTIDRKKYIDSGLVNENAHPTAPYLIYNYSQKCQFSKAWDDVTMMCRGLIVHKDTGEIIARPFSKFFNYEEHLTNKLSIPDEKPFVSKKLDGSLGILYWHNDLPYIATRGSFVSDQAQWATDWLRKNVKYEDFSKKETFLFEIIYPENRIVVNYNFLGLVLLEAINIETGKNATSYHFPNIIPMAKRVEFSSYEELKKLNTENEEGFVLYYPTSGLRLKIKFDEYVKLHKVMTGLSEIGIWEMLRDGKDPIADILDLPDEMHGWISGIVVDLQQKFKKIEKEAESIFVASKEYETRKGKALYIINASEYPQIVFAMLDEKDYKPLIWRMIRPHGAKTYKKDIDQ